MQRAISARLSEQLVSDLEQLSRGTIPLDRGNAEHHAGDLLEPMLEHRAIDLLIGDDLAGGDRSRGAAPGGSRWALGAAVARRRRTLSQRVRDRDGGWCTAPGCSAHSDDAHHIEFKSQGGDPTALWNQTGGCKGHHVCVHELGLRVSGRAPDELVWTLDGEPFTGM